MSIVYLIIQREFIAKVRNKSFIIMTFLSPLLFVGIILFIGFLSTMRPDTKKIALYDQTGIFKNEFLSLNKTNSEFHYDDLTSINIKILKDSIINERYDGLIVIPNVQNNKDLEHKIEFIANESPSITFIENIQDVIAKKLTKENYHKINIDTLALNKAQSKVSIKLVNTTGEQTLKGLNEIKIAIGGAFGYLIMMFIVIYGNMVMRSVIEEKTNRIVEIIISSVKPFQLMMGKIIGTSLAGLLQFLIWAVLGFSLLLIATQFLGLETNSSQQIPVGKIPNQPILQLAQLYTHELWQLPIATILAGFVVYFIGGYFLFSSFYAAIGAAVDSETDSQQFLLPILLPLILAVYIGFFTVVNDPHGTTAIVFSMIPLTSPIVMLMRIPFGVPWWQLLISIGLLFASFILVVWFASKIYRVGILMYGKKPSWKEMYKWINL